MVEKPPSQNAETTLQYKPAEPLADSIFLLQKHHGPMKSPKFTLNAAGRNLPKKIYVIHELRIPVQPACHHMLPKDGLEVASAVLSLLLGDCKLTTGSTERSGLLLVSGIPTEVFVALHSPDIQTLSSLSS